MAWDDSDNDTNRLRVPTPARAALVLSLAATIGFGLWPGPLTDAARTAVRAAPQMTRSPGPPVGDQAKASVDGSGDAAAHP